ncbi:hypothetical protein [Brevundimonas sp. Root1279]|uniref:hypothetical protein n=1 Tax=Brevundimonas sp. Root1279 TaxID=1736443 RepID=UPI0006F52FAA|nr:hypothetical protein [Brevundimonas sp. Root1279]KQW82198.1 hypothetical protein ASC65_07920 [Brevundimonas sp. Root1279]
MLTLIALSAALMQEPPAPPPPAPPEVHTRVMVMGPDGPGSLDKDGDGQVSREEFTAPMNDHFAQIDKNGDGRLSTEELTARRGPAGEHDVMIMRRPRGPGEQNIEVRTFGDGASWSEAGGKRAVFLGGEPGAGEEREIVIHGPGGEWTGDGERRIEVVTVGGEGGKAELDKDGDGKISEVEFTAPLREAFGNMDADHSGFIEDGEQSGDRNIHVFTHRIESRREGDQ